MANMQNIPGMFQKVPHVYQLSIVPEMLHGSFLLLGLFTVFSFREYSWNILVIARIMFTNNSGEQLFF